jgi:hypothetical protein
MVFFDATNHGLAICDGTGWDTGCPSVGDIVGTIVVRLKERKECANGKDISVLVKNRHLGGIPGRLQEENAAKFRNLTLDREWKG